MGKRVDKTDAVIRQLLEDRESYRPTPGKDLLRLWREYLKNSRVRIFLATFVTLVWSAQPFARTLATRFLVDDVLKVGSSIAPEDLPRQFELFWIWLGILAVIWTVFIICHWLRSWLIVGAGRKLIYKLRSDLHEKLQALHIGFFEQMPTGRIVSRVLSDVKVIERWSTSQSVNMMAQSMRIFMGIGVLMYLNWRITLLVLLALPLYAYVFYTLRPKIRATSIAQRRLNAALYGHSAERISAIQVIKAFAKEIGELRTFARMVNNGVRIQMRLTLYGHLLSVLAGFVAAITTGTIILMLMLQVRSGSMTLGSAMAYIGGLTPLFTPVNALTTLITQFQAVMVVLRRVFHILDRTLEVEPGAIKLAGMRGKIHFDSVVFTYPGQESPALNDVSFRFEEGMKVAVMGPSGAGKTTIFNLLLRFYDPQAGAVRVGGVNLQEADPTSIRRHVCLVQQEPVIFSGTIADNIMYGWLDATPDQIIRAAKQAELHEFIMSLPGKYETDVGEGGVTLSGGQKQRLALSTAILTDPEVLLLDDTTSALDAKTEARIRTTLNRVLQNRTSLIITQRIATARECDTILVLERGRLTQMGAHKDLIRERGFYRRIFEQQSLL
jgi:subfamily B ATP-binding cassette protein MsbA